MTKRFLSAFFPTWSIDLVSRQIEQPDKAILLIVDYRGKELVARRCELAKRAGIRPGMPLATARARAADALVFPFKAEAEWLSELARWCYRFSPVCAADKGPAGLPIPDPRYEGLNLDVTGNERLFKGEENLLKQMSQAFSAFGLRSRLAIAPSLGTAWALARYSSKRLSATKDSRAAIAPLPITSLRLSRETEQALAELSISRVEHLFSLSKKELTARFEPELLKRLYQALGKEAEPLEADKPEPLMRLEKIFNGSTSDMNTIAQACSNLLEDLLKRLEPAGRKVAEIELELKTVEGEVFQKKIPLSFPSRDRKHLWSLLHTQVEKLCFRSGVEQISLSVPQLAQLQSTKTSYITEENPMLAKSEEVAQFFDSLHNTLGTNAVLRMQPQNSHLPERAFSFKPWKEKATDAPASLVDRPSILFNPPQAVRAMSVLPDNPPAWLKWKEHSYQVEQGLGPERICSPWWEGQTSAARDYFKLQLPSGVWLWVFRECETSRWFVHGIWS